MAPNSIADSSNISKEVSGATVVPPVQPGKNPTSNPDSLVEKPKLPNQASSSQGRSDSLTVVKHSFNHRQQIITGSVVMACIALIMVTMNNYNPR